jgi:hypothetical protein
MSYRNKSVGGVMSGARLWSATWLVLLAICLPVRADVFFSEVQPLVYAGTSDSPANLTTTGYSGVAMISWWQGTTAYIGTGVLIAPNKLLTAAHIFDQDGNGDLDSTGTITVNFSSVSDAVYDLAPAQVTLHENFTGFPNDARSPPLYDLAVLTLPVDLTIPFYPIWTGNALGQEITMVGYGMGGNGTGGQSGGIDLDKPIKREGWNVIDATGGNQVYVFDFDSPDSSPGPLGGESLGIHRESQLGSGDSGGPAFVELSNGTLALLGINTFRGIFDDPPYHEAYPGTFGTGGGGLLLAGYIDWLQTHAGPLQVVPAPGAFLLTLVGLAGVQMIRRKRL